MIDYIEPVSDILIDRISVIVIKKEDFMFKMIMTQVEIKMNVLENILCTLLDHINNGISSKADMKDREVEQEVVKR